jgi:hypothetical protein
VAAVDEMMAPDFISHTPLLSVQAPDREDVKWLTAQLSAAVSNPSIHFEDQLAAGDKVVSAVYGGKWCPQIKSSGNGYRTGSISAKSCEIMAPISSNVHWTTAPPSKPILRESSKRTFTSG